MRNFTMQHNGSENRRVISGSKTKCFYTNIYYQTIRLLFNFNKEKCKITTDNSLSIPQDNRIQRRPCLPTDRRSPRKEPTNEQPPLNQTEFRTPKPRRNLDPTLGLSGRRQNLSTQRQHKLRYKGSRFKGNKGWGTRFALQTTNERTYERTARLNYIKQFFKFLTYSLQIMLKLQNLVNFFFCFCCKPKSVFGRLCLKFLDHKTTYTVPLEFF